MLRFDETRCLRYLAITARPDGRASSAARALLFARAAAAGLHQGPGARRDAAAAAAAPAVGAPSAPAPHDAPDRAAAGGHPRARRAARRLHARRAAVRLLQREGRSRRASTSSWRTAWPASSASAWSSCPSSAPDWRGSSSSDDCDLVMAGVAVTTLRAAEPLFSASYLDETAGLRRSGPRARAVLQLGRHPRAGRRSPSPSRTCRTTSTSSASGCRRRSFASSMTTSSALFRPGLRRSTPSRFRPSAARRGRCCYPQFSVVVPEPGIMKVPLAYPIAGARRGVRQLHEHVDRSQAQGRHASTRSTPTGCSAAMRHRRPPRWSIIRNVLHWVD